MGIQEQVFSLSTLVTRDDAGRHFTERYPDEILDELEEADYITIDRPIHRTKDGQETPWGQAHWTVEVTESGVDLVNAYPEYQPTGA